MIKVQINPIWRGTKVHTEQRKLQHASMSVGKIQAFALGTTPEEASARVRQIASIHVHALNLEEQKQRGNPLTYGIPSHYRLATPEEA